MYRNPYYQTDKSAHHKDPSTVEVVGEGTVTAAPDRAVIVLGAVTEGTVLQTIQSENAAIITRIINALLNLNIPRERIQTTDFRIDVLYDYEDGRQIFRGYRVTHLLQITTDTVGQTGLIVDTAVSQGANTVTSIRFALRNPDAFINQALSLAIGNARQKAITIANSLGITLSAVPIEVQELPLGREPIPFATAMLAAEAPTPIQPGQLTVRAAVRVKYRIL
jgi:uncharacterized protein YggE